MFRAAVLLSGLFFFALNGQHPIGAVARCANGWYVFRDTGTHTCEGAGGVSEWLGTPKNVSSPPPTGAGPERPIGAVARCGNGYFVFRSSGDNTCKDAGGVAEWLSGAMPPKPPTTWPEQARVPSPTTRSRRAASPLLTPTGTCGSKHWIEEVAGDGKIIKLEDGTLWRVNDLDSVKTAIWLPVDDVIVCGTTMVNADEEETAIVSPIMPAAATSKPTPAASERRYQIQAAANDETFVIDGEVFEAKTYCFGFQKGDPVVFASGGPNGICVSASFVNVRTGKVCQAWCK